MTTLESLEYVKQLLDNAWAELWKIKDSADLGAYDSVKVRTIFREIGSTENYLVKEVLRPMRDEREGKK